MLCESFSNLRRRLPAVLLAAGCAVGGGNLWAADGPLFPGRTAQTSAAMSNASVYSMTDATNTTYMALMVKAANLPTVQESRDHVVLFDTSASQIGAHRKQALSVVRELFAKLPQGDRVSLMAVDLQTQSITQGWTDPRGDAAQDALKTLSRRAPLGATDLAGGLDEALSRVTGERPTSIIYIGDGMSMAELLDAGETGQLVRRLAMQRVPVHSYAVGPKKDLQLLGILAQQTGGVVLFDSASEVQDQPASVAAKLASATHAPIYYPDEIALNDDRLEMLPREALPLRADRDTVYLVKGRTDDAVNVSITGDRPEMSLSVSPSEFQRRNTFVRNLWNRATQDDGISVAFAGQPMLRMAQAEFDNNVADMVAAGEKAIAIGNADQAKEIALAIREIDPNNVNAEVLLRSAKTIHMQNVAFQPGGSLLDDPAVLNAADADIAPNANSPLDNLGEVEQQTRFRTEKVARDIDRRIAEARALAQTDPTEALEQVKRAESVLRGIDNINPEVRLGLLRRLRAEGEQIANRVRITQEEMARLAERQVALEAQARLLDLAAEQENELEQLIDRVRALMVEGYHGDGEAFERAEAVARVAVELEPGNGPAAAALFTAEAAGQLDKAFRLRSLRYDRFLETMYQVELSHVPFPDEPPIRWPSAADWKALTERRRKWASVDLKKNSPSEERIQQALRNPVDFQLIFEDNTLREAIQYLADALDITILPDQRSLDEENISLDDERITLELGQITLRSALKIMLEPYDLTYIVEDEVMKIVPISVADTKLSTRVYPVADLVIPITNNLAAGLGQGFGGLGGSQGAGGFGQGGQFGQGAAPFGGPGGGGGAGLFNVPATPVPWRPVEDVQEAEEVIIDLDDNLTSEVAAPFGLGFAQVQDDGFRLDNSVIESLKDGDRKKKQP